MSTDDEDYTTGMSSSPRRHSRTHSSDLNQEQGNNSLTKGFDHRENEPLPASPAHVRKAIYNTNHDPISIAGSIPSSNGASGHHGSSGIELQFLPPDQRPGLPGDLLAALIEPEIEDDTEAAEALRANASIKVGKVGKVARSVNAQTVRKLVKKATLRGHGNKRGKPPRIPPGLATAGQQQQFIEDGNIIYAVQEGDDESEYLVSGGSESERSSSSYAHEYSRSADHAALVGTAAAAAAAHAADATARQEVAGRTPVTEESGEDDDHSAIGNTKESTAKKVKGGHPLGSDRYAPVADDNSEDVPEEVVAATMDTGRKLMGALDPHNMLQFQRWRRKKKGGKKKRKSYVKGKVIDGRHELYTLSIAVMLGVRTSIARTNTIISASDGPGKKMLSPQDFMAEEKYEFAPKGSPTTPPHKLSHTFKFKDYAPVAFAYLRRMFGVNEFDFLLSVCGNANFIEFISNAKSGQFFFYSSDGKYMIKTMTNTESKFLRRILPHYFRHCTQNPNTLLTKFLGMYRVKLYHLRRNVKFVIMNSVYYTDKSLQTFYDLKGSEIGRNAKPGEEVLKDNDLRKKLPEEAFTFTPELRGRLREQIKSDCEFLRKMQIMDYSMLIGIHHIPYKQGDHRNKIAEPGFRISEHRSKRNIHRKMGGNLSDHEYDSDSSAYKGGSSVASGGPEGSLKGVKVDSTRRLIRDIRETAHASNFEFAGLLEDEDDCSYLEGSQQYNEKYARKLHAQQQHPKYDDVEMKKEQTIEQIYWPFHRFYDINGHRRMKAKECYRCEKFPCTCDGISNLIKAWNIPEFTPPLSERKDGGLMMDTTNMTKPMVFHGRQGDMPYEGKIYFMGIIDILQQYNARKRVETTYRKIEVRGQHEPSCVSPDDYADRFVNFFDEYSRTAGPESTSKEDESAETDTAAAGKSDDQVSLGKSEAPATDQTAENNGKSSGSAQGIPQEG
ncbi:phosphatidylinositol-4-phosphate 5-kinase [Nitzschia inconspicua]|uniref:Phosphatidylinositol-4-phosphate 5-kinase n=1 Tax=Nitzschia inconspicua TaxID=303405 RepID=A0A9K3L8A1_9STRA|nr:phosphatidylinositol-4-phosphate 5-kinase [Nitzschia inconspicua]